jgi:CheY-like chemotaxis protein
MDRKTRERAFDPYFSTKAENRGFGLASVHGFVKSHDALMEVDSEEGKGTSIRITMSCATTPRRTPQIEGDFQFENKRILIVDDDTVVLSAVSKLLMRLGADVSTADSGEAALAVLNRADNMDLVLLDVSMPAVDGVETSRRIRAKADSLPIVFMSGHTRRAVPLELSTDDNSTFLSKPFSISALHKACANVFKSKGQDG